MTHKAMRTLKLLVGIAHLLVLGRGRGGALALWPASAMPGGGSQRPFAPARAACGPVLLVVARTQFR